MEKDLEIRDYRDLEVWRLSHEFVVEIYRITKGFPQGEVYGLTSQIRRASFSVPANIAEGNGKQHMKEYIQFLYYSKGSLNEVRYFLLLSKDLGYIDEQVYLKLAEATDRIGMMLMGLIKSLKRKS